MKKLLCILSAVMAGIVSLSAQDLITKKNGEDIKAKITEVGPDEIKYRRWDNPEGPLFTMPVSEILVIRYENGTNEVFNRTQPSSHAYSGRKGLYDNAVSPVVPGMRYKEYKDFYSAKDYVHEAGDLYSPALGGVLSWIIPGLGQMVCGEIGRGFGYFGGAVASSVVMGIGAGVAAGSAAQAVYDDDYDDAGSAIAGTILILAGSISLLAVDIAAIVDGVKVAKIKNMYLRDTRDMASVKMDLSPYLATVSTGVSSAAPVAGLSLKLSF